MSALRDSLKSYLALRRALGTRLAEPGMALSAFVSFLEAEGLDYITTECALRWARQPEWVQPATWARKLTAVRGFASWLSAGISCGVPPPCRRCSRHPQPPATAAIASPSCTAADRGREMECLTESRVTGGDAIAACMLT